MLLIMQAFCNTKKVSAMPWIFHKFYAFRVFSSLSLLKMTSVMASSATDAVIPIVHRLPDVTGDQEKQNDLILCSLDRPISSALIFFGGDVQNYPEIMAQHRTNRLYIDWNLEETARILAKRFPNSLVMIVKPKEMLLNTFSIFSNFVEFDQDGLPTLFKKKDALIHLSKLYHNAIQAYNKASYAPVNIDNNMCTESSHDHLTKCGVDVPLTLVGFSKGCVPLNQLMYEMVTYTEDMPPETSDFVSKIKSIYWLDAGHNGRKDIWITNESILQKIASTKLELFVHITPYQIKDPNRPWIGKEEKKFIQKLKSFSVNVKETRHHFDDPGSLELHFSILKEF